MITSHIENSIAIISASNPPVNALSHVVRQDLLQALNQAQRNDAVKAIVICCEGAGFFSGADIREFDKSPQEPMLTDLVEHIEAIAKPVIASLHGNILGGGLEIAMACHYRIASRSAMLGLPEVKLGLLPAAGGTQRLPRLIGLEAAMPMMIWGESVSAENAKNLGLVDQLANDTDLQADTLSFAQSIMGIMELPRSSERQVVGTLASIDDFEAAHSRKIGRLEAPAQILDCLRASMTQPFEQGRKLERLAMAHLKSGNQSKSLIHNFFAERAARKISNLAKETKPRPIDRVGIIGAGTMGVGIAINFLSTGIPVTLVERETDALDRGVKMIEKHYDRAVQKNKISRDHAQSILQLLTPTIEMEGLADSDLIIEAVFELMDIKQDIFRKLDANAKPGAILATNTSYLDIDEIAAVTKRPESVVGLHFFSPANIMKLLEVVRAKATADDVLQSAMTLAKRINKVPVLANVCFGFIGNRMLAVRQTQAVQLALEGAMPADIDKVLLDFGFPMGPFQMTDLAGLDIGWDPRKSAGLTLRECLCEAGLRGQKNGKGYYDYDENRNRSASPVAEQIIRKFARDNGIVQREFDDQDILKRLLFPLVNEAAHILDEGISQRGSDIDVVWINGYGWPAYTGGPAFWADGIGLDNIVTWLDENSDRLGSGFTVSRLLRNNSSLVDFTAPSAEK